MPGEVRIQIVSSCAAPPAGDGWLHEVKHDGHLLLAMIAGGSLRLLSRNGLDRTPLFQEPFRARAEAGLPAMVLDGEIAVPDERGVTHLDASPCWAADEAYPQYAVMTDPLRRATGAAGRSRARLLRRPRLDDRRGGRGRAGRRLTHEATAPRR